MKKGYFINVYLNRLQEEQNYLIVELENDIFINFELEKPTFIITSAKNIYDALRQFVFYDFGKNIDFEIEDIYDDLTLIDMVTKEKENAPIQKGYFINIRIFDDYYYTQLFWIIELENNIYIAHEQETNGFIKLKAKNIYDTINKLINYHWTADIDYKIVELFNNSTLCNLIQ